MALEDAINRLANVIGMSQEGTAVAEIIRERNEALKEREKAKGNADYYRNERDKFRERVYGANRRISALKGVITKMKKARG